MAKANRKVRAAARALEKQRAKKFKPLFGIKHKPYRIWAAPKDYPSDSLARFVEQAELASGDYVVSEQAGWISFEKDVMSEEFAIKLAVNERIRCAGPFCLIIYPLEV